MRVLYHHRTQGEEPESIHIAAIVEALRALGHEVRVVGPAAAWPHATLPRRPSVLGRIKRAAPGLLFELLQLAYNLVVDRRIARAIEEFQPDLVYERYALFNYAGVRRARQRGIPLILEVNTPYAQAWATYFGLRLKRLARWLERRTWSAATHIITVTEAQRHMLVREGVAAHAISVCHNAIDPDWFDPQRQRRPQLAAALGLAATVVGFVGTMNRWQGMPAFTAVLRAVFARCAGVSFLFVGDGEFRRAIEDFCRAEGYAGRVVFTGRKPHAEIPPLLALMDIAVLLDSNAYGSPMKIFEYMGMAKAIIAPRVGPVMEVLRDGQTGLLIDAGDAAQMAEQIVRLVNDPALRLRLGEAGRQYVTNHHTWRQNALRIEAIYAAILAPPRAGNAADPC
ncbi:glycosyltransferase involved in cell wall biosynthesis [Janthinobacterium sp. CG_23.3]|uniref:glycosyltransferase family 4 protein n=1 Tax=Janthinobacterium sp. CG_23.3 TaxID=3349634 RepID=UPI0038D4B94E